MSTVIFHSERFAEHQTPPGHPERPERAEVLDVIAKRWQARGLEIIEPADATHDQLARVHDPRYIRTIADTSGRSAKLDPDTYTSPESYDIARLAAGACVGAVDRVAAGSCHAAVALVRPPGHHAERNRAMGFCLFNNAAVAAAHARAIGLSKVAVVDYDVHHGNGTQHIFEEDRDVLYVSTHQYPYYPGTGAADEVGLGRGRGFTVNVPLEAGAVAEDFHLAFSDIIVPVLTQYAPDVVIVSAGFDAHEHDPLGGLRLTAPAFAAMTMELRAVAERCAGGRMVVITEGGYDLEALAASLDAVVDVVHGPAASPAWPSTGITPSRGRAAVDAVRPALAPFWRL